MLESLTPVRESDPQQQGLKRFEPERALIRLNAVRESDPQQQGLKPIIDAIQTLQRQVVRESDPQQQGLKRRRYTTGIAARRRSVSPIHNNKD